MHGSEEQTPPSHTATRVIVVAALAALMCFWHLPDLSRVLGAPLGDWGFQTDGSVVFGVTPGGAAQRSGLHSGDRIELLADASTRSEAIGSFAANPGQVLTVRVRRHSITRTIVLRADAEPSAYFPMIILRELLFVIPLAIGIVLLLLRPGLPTWGLFLYILGAANAPTAVADFRLASGLGERILLGACTFVSSTLGSIGLVLFAFSLSRVSLRGWRMAAIAVAGGLGLLETVPTVFYDGKPPGSWPTLLTAVSVVVLVLALGALLDAYLHVNARFKQRLQWIGCGLLVASIADLIDGILFPNFESYAAHTGLSIASACFPIIAAYAILRERVVDINFAISRTLVYGTLTAVIVGVFAIIDFFSSKFFERAHLSLPIDMVAALAMGFSFHSVQRKVDVAVDRLLFRQRYRAELRLKKAANAVLHVNAAETVAHFLVGLPTEVLDLTGAALYKKTDRDFRLIDRAGWPDDIPPIVRSEDPLVVYVAAELEPLRLSEIPLRSHLNQAGALPVLAVPLVLRRELVGFVLYGAHRTGADLDADEIGALVPLVTNAMVTYDHLEAVALREEVYRLRSLSPVATA